MQETKKAFRKLPNLEQAITALSNLKGVGTTMASGWLSYINITMMLNYIHNIKFCYSTTDNLWNKVAHITDLTTETFPQIFIDFCIRNI